MWKKLTFKRKIGVLIGVQILALIVVGVAAAVQMSQDITQGRRDRLVAAVQSLRAVVAEYQSRAASGAMPLQEAQNAAKEAVRLGRYGGAEGKSDYFFAFAMDGMNVVHPFKREWEGQMMLGKIKDADGTDIVKLLLDASRASADGRAFALTSFPKPGGTDPVPKLQYVERVAGWNWVVGSGLYMDDVQAQVRLGVFKMLSYMAAVLVVVTAVGWLVARSVLGQIGGDPQEAIAAMGEVAHGNLAVDLGRHPADSLLGALAAMVTSLQSSIGQVRQSTDSISTAASEIAMGNSDLSQRTEKTAASLQQTASSMEQLTSTVRQTAASAHEANDLASAASSAAAKGGDVVRKVVTTMNDINGSSKKISDIIGVIDGIAFQTNILALNAAVESARAGEQGRGFAVVAAEVRTLAQRSAEAAREIKALIEGSVDKVEAGTHLVDDAGRAMEEIVASVRSVSEIIEKISSASVEQSSGLAEVNTAVTHLDQMTQQNAALVEQSAAAADSLRQQAGNLANVVSAFRTGAQADLAH